MSEQKLFDDIEHKKLIPQYSMREFEYLNTSADSDAKACRAMLEDWFNAFPVQGKSDIRGRIRSNDKRQFQSSFFELFLFQLLTRLGCKLVLHPTITASSKKPDFLVTSSNGEKFYLEATVVTDLTDNEEKRDARKNKVYDAINKINSPNFYINILSIDGPNTSPSGKKIKLFLTEKLSELSHQNCKKLPKWEYHSDEWKIVFTPIPKGPETRGKSDIRPIGSLSSVKWATTKESIRKSLDDKANKYKIIEHPYIVAINVLGVANLREAVMDALFGEECFCLQSNKMTRTYDGFWIKKGKSINTNVNGILAFGRLSHWGILEGFLAFFLNPNRVPTSFFDLLKLPHFTIIGKKYQFREGLKFGEIFHDLPVANEVFTFSK